MGKLWRSRTCALALATTLASASAVASDDLNPDYFADDRSEYSNAFILIPDSATPIRVRGRLCHYRYHARVIEQVRGKFSRAEFDFFTNVGLTMGDEYLVLFSEHEARRYHPAMDFIYVVEQNASPEERAREKRAQDDQANACAKAMTGYFFDYTELHLVKRVMDPVLHTPRRAVSFEYDVHQDYPASETQHEVHELVDLEYVRRQLNR